MHDWIIEYYKLGLLPDILLFVRSGDITQEEADELCDSATN